MSETEAIINFYTQIGFEEPIIQLFLSWACGYKKLWHLQRRLFLGGGRVFGVNIGLQRTILLYRTIMFLQLIHGPPKGRSFNVMVFYSFRRYNYGSVCEGIVDVDTDAYTVFVKLGIQRSHLYVFQELYKVRSFGDVVYLVQLFRKKRKQFINVSPKAVELLQEVSEYLISRDRRFDLLRNKQRHRSIFHSWYFHRFNMYKFRAWQREKEMKIDLETVDTTPTISTT